MPAAYLCWERGLAQPRAHHAAALADLLAELVAQLDASDFRDPGIAPVAETLTGAVSASGGSNGRSLLGRSDALLPRPEGFETLRATRV